MVLGLFLMIPSQLMVFLYFNNHHGKTRPVGSFESGKSVYGVYDLSGNVSEWVSASYDPASYEYVSTINPSVNDLDNQRKVVRGGSWKDIAYYLETGTRSFEHQDTTRASIGFRCAMTYLGRSSGYEF